MFDLIIHSKDALSLLVRATPYLNVLSQTEIFELLAVVCLKHLDGYAPYPSFSFSFSFSLHVGIRWCLRSSVHWDSESWLMHCGSTSQLSWWRT